MKFFHTADWHLGKLVQGVTMIEEQRHILEQFIEEIQQEKPDAVIIAGDLYDRGVPPTEAVNLLDEVLETIVLKMKIPVLAVAGNHDSPSRLNFGSRMMTSNGCHIVGQLTKEPRPIVLHDAAGEVHFHLVPYTDPSMVRHELEIEEIRSHNDAMKSIVDTITRNMDPTSRHVFVGHAFVTPQGEVQENTSESERPLSIGGAEYVSAQLFSEFQYTALGHLHQSHYVLNETIRYAGSPLKYSISEEKHNKSFLIVELNEKGEVKVEKRVLHPRRDMRTVEGTMDEILQHPVSEDYIFVRLADDAPILFPMEKVRSVYPNAMHIERVLTPLSEKHEDRGNKTAERHKMDDVALFRMFYNEVKGIEATEESEAIFIEVLEEIVKEDLGQEQDQDHNKQIHSPNKKESPVSA
jgi:exonuclease SbcD